MYPEFGFYRRGDAAIWIDQSVADAEFLERLTDGDGLLNDARCEIIKDQRKVKIGRVSLNIAGQPRTIFVKRYNAFSFRYRLLSTLVPSGAFRSMRGAAILREAKIACAKPLAVVENRRAGALTKSFYLSEEIAGGETVDAYWDKHLRTLNNSDGRALRRHFLMKLAQLFKMLHAANIYHNDLKDANILTVALPDHDGIEFVLLDLDGVAQTDRLSRRRVVKNLVQINRTFGRYLRRPEKVFFLKNYLGGRFRERDFRRAISVSVLDESVRLDRLNRHYD